MILRIDRIATEMPPPSIPDPAGAAVVQELLGGKFGEMSTFMNYTFQSFNFRARQEARPFFDLVVEHRGRGVRSHRAGRRPRSTRCSRAPARRATCRTRPKLLNPQQIIAGGAAALVQDSNGKPWNGDYVTSTGDLVEDLTHNFFLETGARNNKLKVYEMVDHPAARALTGYLLVRGGVHQLAYARAIENLTGADLMKLFPSPRIPTDKIPECRPHLERGEHLKIYRFSPSDYLEIAAVFNGVAPGDGRAARGRRRRARGLPGVRPAGAGGRVRARLRARGDRRDRPQAAQRPPACPTSRPASWPTTPTG